VKQIAKITKKEFKDYFSTPVAYIVIAVFALVIGVYFGQSVFVENQASLRKLFEFIPLLWIVVIPALTMKSFAEEIKTGTLEVMMTLPITKVQIILGKFFANLLIVILMLLTTLPAAFTITNLGNPDIGQMVVAYIGLLLLASVYILIGQAVSINSKNQIVAFIISAFVIAILYFIGEVQVLTVVPANLREIFEFLGLGSHFRSIARGVIDSRDVIYYFSLITIAFIATLLSFNRIQNKGK